MPEVGGSPSFQAGAAIMTLGMEDNATRVMDKAQRKFDQTSAALEDAASSAKEFADEYEEALTDMAKAGKGSMDDMEGMKDLLQDVEAALDGANQEFETGTKVVKQHAEAMKASAAMAPAPKTIADDLAGDDIDPLLGPVENVPQRQDLNELLSAAKLMMEKKPEMEADVYGMGSSLGAEIGGEFWDEFWRGNLASFRDELRNATYDDLKTFSAQITETIGDEQAAVAFWQAIANSKKGNKLFVEKLAKDYFGDEEIAESFYDMLGTSSARKSFIQDVGRSFATGVIPIWQRPIGQIITDAGKDISKIEKKFVKSTLGDIKKGITGVAASIGSVFMFSRLLEEAFEPVIDLLQWIVEPLLIPLADAFSELSLHLRDIVTPLTVMVKAFSEALLPPFVALLKAFIPIGQRLAQIFQVMFHGLAPVLAGLAGIIDYISKNEYLATALALTIGVLLIPQIIGLTKVVIGYGAASAKWFIGMGGRIIGVIKGIIPALTGQAAATATATASTTANTAATTANTWSLSASLAAMKVRIVGMLATAKAFTLNSLLTIGNTTVMAANTLGHWAAVTATYSLAAAKGVLATATAALTTTFGMLTTVILANPLVWLVGVIAGVTFAVYKLVDAFVGWGNVFDFVTNFGLNLIRWFLIPFQVMLESLMWLLRMVKDAGIFMIDLFLTPLKVAVKGVVTAFGLMYDGIKSVFNALWWLGGQIGDALAFIFNPFRWIDAAMKAFSGLGEALLDWMPGWMKWMFGIPDDDEKAALVESGEATMEEYSTGVERASGTLETTTEEALEGVGDQLPHSEAKKGPLRGLKRSGGRIMQNLAQGVMESETDLQAAVQSTLENVQIPRAKGLKVSPPDYGKIIAVPIVSALEKVTHDIVFTLNELSRKSVELRQDASVFARFQI